MRVGIIASLLVLLVGCQMGHQPPHDIQQELNQALVETDTQTLATLPDEVSADLMPSVLGFEGVTSTQRTPEELRFSVNAQGVDVHAFFGSLVQDTPYSVVVHPGVTGYVSLSLQSVSLDEVLEVIADIYGYDIQRKNKIIQVYPSGLRTETFKVDYLQLTRQGSSTTSVSTGSLSNSDTGSGSGTSTQSGGTLISTQSESAFWVQLQQSINAIIGAGEGQTVVVAPQSSLVTVRAHADQLREVRQFLGLSQERLRRQVILEAKILEVTLSDGYQQGINWSNITKTIGGTVIGINRPTSGESLPGQDNIGSLLGGQTNITIGDGNFEAVLSFMETQGDVNVLSSPRVTAANNQKAVIKVGNDEYYVTNVSSNASTENNNVASDLELTPFFSGISLDVTPQIDDEGGVLLHVHPAVIEVTEDVKQIDLGASQGSITLPLASSSIRESDSIIHARSGDVVVIGGLMRTSNTDQVSKVPLLGDIPALGHLFRNVSKLTTKTELVILIKPTVVGADTWQNEIERSRNLLDSWFPEG
ncbi:pilus (MSHA type) biogenesis protein MshL [Thaumasiovibrio subtropicus]|uniref:pilus (MSHA type) biogenesis protein MshL n=1 Tax=Thaumasiovibrio subtropicus TaxID=1891207 RepID=UPI000B364A2E|nr:pilus (MSHA type) biogenesis protein MshL [Thaumasiovibrio subtropicus]